LARRTSANGSSSSAWPTPVAQDDQKSPEAHMAMKARMPGGPRQTITSLTVKVKAWPTPVAADSGEKVTLTTHQGACLLREAVNWSTPSVADVTGGRMARSGARNNEPLMNGQAAALSSRLVPMTYPVGEVSSHPRRSLNPLFVEWLMGWPPGWTLGVWTDFACSGTELSRFKRRMRSALSQLTSHAAPPAQLNLFGG
jgi:hypothetical protein